MDDFYTFGPITSFSNKVHAGDNKGKIFTFVFNSMEDIKLESSAIVSQNEITALAASADYICAGIANGEVLIMNSSKELQRHHKNRTEAMEYPCTGMKLVDDVLVTISGSGHLRLYDLKQGGIKSAELGAHSKVVTALDAAKTKDGLFIATTGEDGVVFVWRFHNNNLEPIKGDRAKDCMLTGVQFLSQSTLLVSAFEKKKLYMMEL